MNHAANPLSAQLRAIARRSGRAIRSTPEWPTLVPPVLRPQHVSCETDCRLDVPDVPEVLYFVGYFVGRILILAKSARSLPSDSSAAHGAEPPPPGRKGGGSSSVFVTLPAGRRGDSSGWACRRRTATAGGVRPRRRGATPRRDADARPRADRDRGIPLCSRP